MNRAGDRFQSAHALNQILDEVVKNAQVFKACAPMIWRELAMQKLKNAFDILGIEPSTDHKTLRTAWRALVRSYHPDLAKTDPEAANARLAEINAAFDAVCACSAEEVVLLQNAIARDARRAEKRRRDMRAARERARQAEQAATRPAPRTCVVRTPAAAQSTRAPAAQTDVAFEQPRAGSDRRATKARPQTWNVSQMAAQAFEAARVKCAPHIKDEPQSLYL